MPQWIIIVLTAAEVLLLVLVALFFLRLKRSEQVVLELQANQERLLQKLQFNAQLEQELVSSFAQRQQELVSLTQQMERRAVELNTLLEKAERITRSSLTLRQMVIQGHRRGQSPKALAHATGLTLDEVALILKQAQAGQGLG
ncbi:MAG: hypothetical protein LDL30_01220 [Desulfovibrio sp.]|nr:hypothetical protein [Desulfovibrio sp.]MCA1985313.1 hypothetical protein [Desulfovibrio sp.]